MSSACDNKGEDMGCAAITVVNRVRQAWMKLEVRVPQVGD